MTTSPPRRRAGPLLLLAAIILCGTTFWGYLSLTDAQDSADAAAIDAAAARRSAARIESLRGPAAGGSRESSGDGIAIGTQIARAAEAAGIDGEPGIHTQPPRKVGNSPYEERPTQVVFQRLTMRQVVTFLSTITTDVPGLRVTELRLSGGRESDPADRWEVDATLSSFTLAAPAAIVIAALTLGLVGCAGSTDPEPPAAEHLPATQPGTERDLARARNARGVRLLRERRYPEAERALKDALAADAAFGPAHNSLGDVYFHQSKFYDAAWEFQYAAKLMQNQAEPRNNLGLVFEQVGKLDDAIGWYQRAVALEPNNTSVIGNLARARLRRGDSDEEVRDLLLSLISRDSRPEWVNWAKERLAFFRRPATRPE
jgi:Tfp pilus assembly protein PilF